MSQFDVVIDRKNTKCYKWDFLLQEFGKKDLLPMWVADMEFQAPAKVIEVMHKRAAHGIFGYTGLTDSFYKAIINWLEKRFEWKIKKEWIVATPGIVPALNFAIQTYTHKHDRVLIQTPVYKPFFLRLKIINAL